MNTNDVLYNRGISSTKVSGIFCDAKRKSAREKANWDNWKGFIAKRSDAEITINGDVADGCIF